MIKKYNNYLLEKMMFDEQTIIDILKSLKKTNDTKLINKIINKKDNKDKSLLMNIVEANDESMIDFILQFNVDINQKTINGDNVLFYCKNVKIVNKLIDAGADVTAEYKHINRNLLIHLAYKKIFNVDLYKRIMSKGVDLKSIDLQKQTVLCNSILNKSMLQFLIDNNVDLNGPDKYNYLYLLCYAGRYHKSKSKYFINTLKFLLDNGMKIDNIFLEILVNNFNIIKSKYDIFDIFEILDTIKKYFKDDDVMSLWYIFNKHNFHDILEITKKLIRMFESPKVYFKAKDYWRSSNFEEKFADIIQEFPYFEATNKYNL